MNSIFRVQEGDAVFSPRLAGFVLDAFASTDAPPVDEDLDRLTQREREVLRLIARGYAYKEIAKQLFISVKTVESHVSAIAAQAPAVQPARADPLGDGTTAGVRDAPPDRARLTGRSHTTRVAPANGISSMGATRTGADGFGAWIIWPSPM